MKKMVDLRRKMSSHDELWIANRIYAEGARMIAQALQHNSALTDLSFSGDKRSILN